MTDQAAGPFDDYVRAHRERDAREASTRHEVAWQVARAASRILKEEFGARRVLVFGSLAGGRMHERSDIDLAVEGLAPERYLEAMGRMHGLGPFEVQLAPLEECRPHIREAALREGVEP